MTDTRDMLARIAGQLAERGAEPVALRALIEEASELGAEHALTRLGLADPSARADLDELRELLGAWREAKKSALRAAIGWVAKIVTALVLLGLAVKFGAVEWMGR